MQISDGNFVKVCLKGAGQVFFMENAITGAMFLIAIGYASFASGEWATAVGAVIGLLVATSMAKLMSVDAQSYRAGLYGFNGILVGIALPTFIAVSPQLWFYIVAGAAISAVVTSAFSASITKSWGIPGSTGPFVLTAWLLLAGAYSFGSLHVVGEAPKLASDFALGNASVPGGIELVEIFFRNIGQVYLLGSWISGAIILAGIFIASPVAGIAAVAGSILALATAIFMRADPATVAQGLYGFSPVLTAIAVGTVFLKPSGAVIAYAALATLTTVFVQAGLDVVMAPTGLPTYTAPYVLTMYLFIAPRMFEGPHPHQPVADHFLKEKPGPDSQAGARAS